MIILYKVMKADCTSLIGLIVTSDYNDFLFIPKSEVSNYNYENARLDSKGRVHPAKGLSFSRRNNNIIVSSEWNKICEKNPRNLDELRFVWRDISNNFH